MSKTTKIVLGIVGGFGLLIIIAGFAAFRLFGQFGSAFTTDTDKIDAIAQEIVAHERPAEFEGLFGTDLGGVKLAMTAGDISNEEAIIMFMSFPADESQSMDDLRDEMRRSFNQQAQQDVEFEYAGSREVTIAGETVEVETLVGASETGASVRQDFAAFDSVTGDIGFFMVVAPESWFEQHIADAFFLSME